MLTMLIMLTMLTCSITNCGNSLTQLTWLMLVEALRRRTIQVHIFTLWIIYVLLICSLYIIFSILILLEDRQQKLLNSKKIWFFNVNLKNQMLEEFKILECGRTVYVRLLWNNSISPWYGIYTVYMPFLLLISLQILWISRETWFIFKI